MFPGWLEFGLQNKKVQDYEGYLIFIIALNSIYLNPDHDVAQQYCVGVAQPHTGNFGAHKVSNWPYLQWMINYIFWHDGIYLGTIVQVGHTTFPIYLHFSYIFDPAPSLKRVHIQEGSLQGGFYTSGASVWGLFVALIIVRGVWAPFIDAVPSFPFNCFLSLEVFTSEQLQMKCSGLLQW